MTDRATSLIDYWLQLPHPPQLIPTIVFASLAMLASEHLLIRARPRVRDGQTGYKLSSAHGISCFLFPSHLPVFSWWVMTEWWPCVVSSLLYGQMINNFEESSLLPPLHNHHCSCMIYRRILVGNFSILASSKNLKPNKINWLWLSKCICLIDTR